jgi:hypothetical protein
MLAAAFVSTPLVAQSDAPTIAIRGGTVHTLVGTPIENGAVVIENGLVTSVGASVTVPAGAQVIDAAGLHVYPGLFDAVTRLGLTEVGAVDVTNDYMELGDFNPHLLGMTAVHPASEHIPVARANVRWLPPLPGQVGSAGRVRCCIRMAGQLKRCWSPRRWA